jgi:beta-lactamase regulating signal transducer with metallopeptidase domain
MIAPQLQHAMEMLAGRVANTMFDGLLLAMVVGFFLRISGRQNARTRFAVWFVTLLGIATLPFLSAESTVHRAIAAELTLPSSWAVALIALWSIGFAFLTARLAHGLWRVHELRSGCEELTLPAELLTRLNTARGTRIYVSDEVQVPAAIGFFRPAIILPRSLASELTAEELEVVLLHELAHVERWDDWSNLAQQVVKTIFFFHPAVLWIERRLSLEREMACDDIVLERTGGAKVYAACLISFAEKMQQMRGLALIQGLVHRVCQLSQRLAEILDSERPAKNLVRKPLVMVSAGLVAASIVALPHLPRLVAFHPNASVSEIAQAPGVDTEFSPAAKVITAKYVVPARDLKAAAKLPSVKPATVKKHVRRSAPHRMLAAQAAPAEDRTVTPTLVIFESSSESASGMQVWRLCIWQIAPNGQPVPVASTIELKI